MGDKKPVKLICFDVKEKGFAKHAYTKEQVLEASMALINGKPEYKLKCVRCSNEMSISEFKDSLDNEQVKGLINKLINIGLKI